MITAEEAAKIADAAPMDSATDKVLRGLESIIKREAARGEKLTGYNTSYFAGLGVRGKRKVLDTLRSLGYGVDQRRFLISWK